MGGVKPTWHNSRFNHSDRSEPDCLEYLNCREQGDGLIERQFTAILKIGNDQTPFSSLGRIVDLKDYRHHRTALHRKASFVEAGDKVFDHIWLPPDG
jgi:hypothetical protein